MDFKKYTDYNLKSIDKHNQPYEEDFTLYISLLEWYFGLYPKKIKEFIETKIPGFPSMKYFIDDYLCSDDNIISDENKNVICNITLKTINIFELDNSWKGSPHVYSLFNINSL